MDGKSYVIMGGTLMLGLNVCLIIFILFLCLYRSDIEELEKSLKDLKVRKELLLKRNNDLG